MKTLPLHDALDDFHRIVTTAFIPSVPQKRWGVADGRSGLRQDHSPKIKETEKNWGTFIVRIFC